jgi:hypothetical protein
VTLLEIEMKIVASFLMIAFGTASTQALALPLKCIGSDGWKLVSTDRYVTDVEITKNGIVVEGGELACSHGWGGRGIMRLKCTSHPRSGGFWVDVRFEEDNWEPLYDPENTSTYYGSIMKHHPGAEPQFELVTDLKCKVN